MGSPYSYYIIFPHMWVRHTVRNVGAPHLGLLFPVGLPPSSLCNRSFQSCLESCQQWKLEFLSTVAYRATKIPTTLRVNLPVAIRATKNLNKSMLPVNYRSLQRSFEELPKSYKQWELTFLSNEAFRATKIPITLRADVPVAIRATKNL